MSLIKPEPAIDSPLPSWNPEEESEISPLSNEALKIIFRDRRRWEWSDDLGFIGGPRAKRKSYTLILFSWAAALIDTLLVLSLTVIFAVLLSFLLPLILGPEVFHSFSRGQIYQNLLILFVLIFWGYQVGLRTLMGHTLGEWTYDLRLGFPHERLVLSYMPRVALRSLLVIGTGFVFFPILSLVVGKDVMGLLCGVRLFSLR